MKGLEDLINKVKNLNKKIKSKINDKLREFERRFNASAKEKFLELCFCILVANTSLEKTLQVWKAIGEGFIFLSESKLKEKLKNLGYRFYNKRANYIVLARKYIEQIDLILKSKNEQETREWLVKNIKGIGWKEASHFMRNLGFKNFAILDRHVLKVLREFNLTNEGGPILSKRKYLEVEEKMKVVCEKLSITLAELDLLLFYLDTGKICER
jgi:N-glycosylase/DNA lyase